MNALRETALLAAALLVFASAQAHADASGELARYLAAPDGSYAWREVKSSRLGATEITELALTSQTWRSFPWKHQLFLFRPSTLERSSTQAFLFIHGGRWRPEYEQGLAELPREARIFARLAETLRAPVAVLRQVPFQPLFDRREDALIAYTFDHYLTSGESDWPLLLPMVKSAARAMDAVQSFTRERWQFAVDKFTVTGASKRGWTSWLIAAVDPRVAGVAPMVIDMLNIPAQIELQRETFGALSEQVQDYVAIDLPGRVGTERGQNLMAMVDPYSYRAALDQPKLILLGTNDAYWPLDALKVYWDELPEPKSVLYVPNEGHSVHDLDRLIGGLVAVHRYSANGKRLPVVSWKYGVDRDRLAIDLRSDRAPSNVQAWSASSATRDFRAARWTSHRCHRAGDRYACAVPRLAGRFTAMYAELWFKDPGYPKFPLSTVVCISARPGDSPHC
jgi:PhoPQ-activated pathogenicity-related protein